MDIDKSDGSPAGETRPSDCEADNAKAAKLDSQIRELYDVYGKSEIPDNVRRLAEEFDRERAVRKGKRADKSEPEDKQG